MLQVQIKEKFITREYVNVSRKSLDVMEAGFQQSSESFVLDTVGLTLLKVCDAARPLSIYYDDFCQSRDTPQHMVTSHSIEKIPFGH